MVGIDGLRPDGRAAADRVTGHPPRQGHRGAIRLTLLKIGALVRVSVRRVVVAMASGHPWQRNWAIAHRALMAAAG